MTAILYLVVATWVGYILMTSLLKRIGYNTLLPDLYQQPIALDSWIIHLPGGFLLGTLLLTWTTYICGYTLSWTNAPLKAANGIALTLFLLFALLWSGRGIIRTVKTWPHNTFHWGSVRRETWIDLSVTMVLLIVGSVLMWDTLSIKDGETLQVAYSVYSDFGPHLALIRSFSLGHNFPTDYPHFPGDGIRYHFMFQFLGGNLEHLGLPLDWAYNLPSILAFTAFLMLLYSTVIILFGKRWVALLTLLLFFFRSSFAVFSDFRQLFPLDGIPVLTNKTFIGQTQGEDWGLWTLDVFVNQRHLAFGLGILMLVFLYYLPFFKAMMAQFQHLARQESGKALIRQRLYELLVKPDAWCFLDFPATLVLGVILGLTVYWNGATVIATLLMLAVMALGSKYRLEFLLIAVITVILALAQSVGFAGLDATPLIRPQWSPGFLAEMKSLEGVITYYVMVFGLLPFVLFLALPLLPKGGKWLTLVFFTPLLFATVIQLTPDKMANHKFVLVSVVLLNMLAALFLYSLFTAPIRWKKAVGGVLLVLMILTGIVDNLTLYNLNRDKALYNLNDTLIFWALDNTRPDDVFLSYPHVHHSVLLAGRRIYLGWPYFAWSAGHDTATRQSLVHAMFTETDPSVLRQVLSANGIDYVIVDNSLLSDPTLNKNPWVFRTHFPLVFSQSGRHAIDIYQVPPPD